MSESESLSPQEQARNRALRRLEEGDPEIARVDEAIDTIPITSLDEVQTASRILIGARIYERQIASQFETIGHGVAPLANWIRGHLDDVDEDYPYRMWKRWSFFVARQIPAYHRGDYDDFRTYLWKLKAVGLVEPTETEENEVENRLDKQYYALTDGAFDRPEWQNPQEALYG